MALLLLLLLFTSPEFKNPIDSLGLILKNKTIHDKVLDNYQNREMKTFGNNMYIFPLNHQIFLCILLLIYLLLF